MSEIQANKLKKRLSLKQREFTFLVTFSLPLSSSLLKLPNNMIQELILAVKLSKQCEDLYCIALHFTPLCYIIVLDLNH